MYFEDCRNFSATARWQQISMLQSLHECPSPLAINKLLEHVTVVEEGLKTHMC